MADTGREKVYQAEFRLRTLYDNIALTGNDDDSLDLDSGYKGANQFVIVTQRSTGKWFFVGRMYCPSVTTSTPAARMSANARASSSSVSPSPSIREPSGSVTARQPWCTASR